MATSTEIVEQLFQAMAQGPDGVETMAALLSEDTTFNGPILKANSRLPTATPSAEPASCQPLPRRVTILRHADWPCPGWQR